MHTDPADESLLRQRGIAALRAGDTDQARRLFSAALAADPVDLQAWLWLSGAVPTDAERRYCLLRVQALSPGHPAAARGLALLPDVTPASPLPTPASLPLAAEAPAPPARPLLDTLPQPPAPATPAPTPAAQATTSQLPPLPVLSPTPPARPPWAFIGVVGTLILALLLLVGFVATQLVPGSPQAESFAAAPFIVPTAARSPTALPTAVPTAPPSPTAPPQASPTTAPSAAPTTAPSAAPTVVAPGDDSAAALAARGLLRERRDDDDVAALADYSAAIALDPTYADAYYLRASLQFEQGDEAAGQADYTRALQMDSTSAHAYYHRARIESRLDGTTAAFAAFAEAIRLDPAYANAYYSRSVLRLEQGDTQGAMEDSNATIAADPTFALAYFNRALLYEQRAMLDAAMADYSAAIVSDPLFFSAYYNRAYAYRWYLGDPRKALPDFNQAVALRPNDAPVHCERGGTRAKLGDLAGGVADTSRAIALDPTYACAYYTRAGIYLQLDAYELARDDYTAYLTMVPAGSASAFNASIGRAVAANRAGDQQAALADNNRAIALSPNSPLGYNNRGQVYVDLGDFDAARADWTTAAKLYRALGQSEEAARLEQAIDQLP